MHPETPLGSRASARTMSLDTQTNVRRIDIAPSRQRNAVAPTTDPAALQAAVRDLLEQVAHWKRRWDNERERLAKLWVAYEDLESETDAIYDELDHAKEALSASARDEAAAASRKESEVEEDERDG